MSTDVRPAIQTATEYAELAQGIAAMRDRFHTCNSEIATNGRSADVIAAAMSAHLAATMASRLPTAAQTIWRERVLRPLKADASKPLLPRAVGSIRSWPLKRVTDLHAALTEIEAILADAENDALNELIYAEISRAYS